jgi:tRNA nucleotidyltransferase/poly(A) polymerase
MPTPNEIADVVKLIESVAAEYNIDDAFFVGGYPRTLAMGLPLTDVHDLDVASGSPERAAELAGFVAEAGKAEDFKEHHRTPTTTVKIGNVEIDFQGSQSHDHVAPYVRMWGVPETSISKNIFDRDFPVNALAIRLGSNEILDLTRRGMSDIHDKKVSSILPPDEFVPQNPLMISRAIKLASKYGYKIDPLLWKAMKKYSSLLKKKLTPARLAIEAYVLSKYPQAKVLIGELGIEYLELPSVVQDGKQMAED